MAHEENLAASKGCHNCGFFWPAVDGDGKVGQCRRHAPTVTDTPDAYGGEQLPGEALDGPIRHLVTVFPKVREGIWCGEWGAFDHSVPGAGEIS